MKHKILACFLFIFFVQFFSSQTLKNCSNCATQIIKQEQIKDLSLDEIRLLTNEIYARNGYEFENPRFQQHFESKSWYSSKKDNKKVNFNDIEKKNITLLQNQSKQLKTERDLITAQLKSLKYLVLENKTNELKSKFNLTYDTQYGEDNPKLLKEVLSKIDLDDINYYKNQGLNSVTVDNGFVKILYEVSLDGKSINLYYNYMAHSKIIEDFDEFTDYHSETEFMYNWQFELKGNKLEFIRLAIAG
ncbi:YARHG domain-containing protein [Epilithonimonas ginsengisoli]|uniref:YARHG domain-containing protein n=1 Tax=Epilithonimonas ginsengisoli TaxID=1245592 RepID=A0ABU4JDJ8_9FLAO|nr:MULTISPECIES: YARHG domain-containing protein [Chryseobacterium group]MBV6878903.1 YARHG domain-containing protein [Epilithonimonas sp. FP105]MDW8547745.1 YARHG domain-containing protein [Epilithonimonas ginsengisoli]